MDLKELREKLVNERKELGGKIARLSAFLYGEKEEEPISSHLLREQLTVMERYWEVLSSRIREIDIRNNISALGDCCSDRKAKTESPC